LFEEQQFEEMINQIHSLKGVSGNLGAETLYRALSEFDQALKQTPLPPNLSLYYDRVHQTFSTLLQDLADSPLLSDKEQLLTSFAKTSSQQEKVPLQLLLKSFADLLDQDLGAAIAVFEQLKHQEDRSELQPLLVAIETELENFNLDSVNQYLHVLATHSPIPNPNGNSASCNQAQNFNCG
jgi:HPt (histidine-containing phosphotransfer) domain-containing protein